MSRINGGLIAALAGLAMAATSAAQEPDAPEPAPVAVAEIELQLGDGGEETNFDQWIFGGTAPDGVRKKLAEALARDIARYDERYALTPLQKKKLELAGRADIKRYFDRIESLRVEFRRVKGDWNQIGEKVNEIQQIWGRPHSDLFGDESMVAKTLKKNVTAEQVAYHEKNVYRQRVVWMTGLLHSRLVLSPDQRRRLVNLIVEGTPPLRRYGTFDYDAIMLQVSRLPREKLRSILDEGQCRDLALRFDQARRMEGLLVSQGYLARPEAPAGSTPGGIPSHHVEARR